jgi:ABC-type transporter Mla subunit MlaD
MSIDLPPTNPNTSDLDPVHSSEKEEESAPSITSAPSNPTIEGEEGQPSDVQSDPITKVEKKIESKIDLVGQKIIQVFEVLGKVLGSLLKGAVNVFSKLMDTLRQVLKKLAETLKKIVNDFRELIRESRNLARDAKQLRDDVGDIILTP